MLHAHIPAPSVDSKRARLLAALFAIASIAFSLEVYGIVIGFHSPVALAHPFASLRGSAEPPLDLPAQTTSPILSTRRLPPSSESRIAEQDLKERYVRLRFALSDGTVVHSASLALAKHADWIRPEHAWLSEALTIESSAVAAHLQGRFQSVLTPPQDCDLLTAAADEYGVLRAHVVGSSPTTSSEPCLAREGYEYDAQEAAQGIVESLLAGERVYTVAVSKRSGTITDRTQNPPVVFTLVGPGRSNFKGSGEGRKANVRKGLSERINNVVVPAHTPQSFVKLLGPVTPSRGWRDALVILNGDQLVPAPGGGICQTSTTTYRALLLAGLPIVKRRSHSLYVTYYEKYGVGLDATVYPGQQDLLFENNLDHPIVLQAFADGDEAYVNIYGVPDGRSVALEGPYFWKSAPSDLLGAGRTVKKNQIVWVQKLILPSGEEKRQILLSQYKELPRSLADKYAIAGSMQHAAAPLPSGPSAN